MATAKQAELLICLRAASKYLHSIHAELDDSYKTCGECGKRHHLNFDEHNAKDAIQTAINRVDRTYSKLAILYERPH